MPWPWPPPHRTLTPSSLLSALDKLAPQSFEMWLNGLLLWRKWRVPNFFFVFSFFSFRFCSSLGGWFEMTRLRTCCLIYFLMLWCKYWKKKKKGEQGSRQVESNAHVNWDVSWYVKTSEQIFTRYQSPWFASSHRFSVHFFLLFALKGWMVGDWRKLPATLIWFLFIPIWDRKKQFGLPGGGGLGCGVGFRSCVGGDSLQTVCPLQTGSGSLSLAPVKLCRSDGDIKSWQIVKRPKLKNNRRTNTAHFVTFWMFCKCIGPCVVFCSPF